jgi:hypothetical protein
MTFRAVVGVSAVLAGVAVLERSVDASPGHAGACQASEAYVSLAPGERIKVRAEPSPEAVAVGTLAEGVVTLEASQSGWVRIALAADGAHGWIPADRLEVGSRRDGITTIHSRPGLMGRELLRLEHQDVAFRVLGCRGDWLQVINAQYGNVWIDRWCAQPDGCR